VSLWFVGIFISVYAFVNQIKEISHLITKFDECLVFTWEQMRKQDLRLEHWWEVYHQQASLVVDDRSFNKVLRCKDQWSTVASELDALVNNSLIGMKCFGHANTYLVGAEMQTMVTEALHALGGKEVITRADLNHISDKLMGRAANKAAASALAMKREVSCRFRNLNITFQVANFQEDCI
jgi:hypothetical protein